MLLQSFDFPIQKFLTGFANHNRLFDECVYALSNFDTFKGIAMMSLLWFAWFYRSASETSEQEAHRQTHLVIVLIGSITAVILSRILQMVLHVHQRPVLANLGLDFPSVVDPSTVNAWNSFPSDHAMLFFALATGIWQINRAAGGVGLAWTIFVVCLPRVYLGIHYPSDVVAGAVLGVLTMLAFERLPFRGIAARVQSWSKTRPGTFYWCAFMLTEQVAHLFDDARGLASMMFAFFKS
ncbi:MAG: phosphatase PAP2 family protein [Pseudomonadota bacterium]|nr:phosphatase PAP2 family protein [Pseudomonadota bacterium]